MSLLVPKAPRAARAARAAPAAPCRAAPRRAARRSPRLHSAYLGIKQHSLRRSSSIVPGMSRPPSPASARRGPPEAPSSGRSTSTPQRAMPKPLRSLSLDTSDAALAAREPRAPRAEPDTTGHSPARAPSARPWSPTRALGRGAAFAAQSIVDVLTRSLSPTLYAASLFDSPRITSPTQAAAFHEVFGERTESPETFAHTKPRAAPRHPRRPSEAARHAPEWPRATPDSMRHRGTPALDAARVRGTPALHRAAERTAPHAADAAPDVGTTSSRAATPAADAAAAYPPRAPLRTAAGEHAISIHSTIVAPQARRGAVWLRSRRRAGQRRAAHRPGVVRQVLGALSILAHPRQCAAAVRRRAAAQARYWDEAFREPETGARCWRPPWLHAYVPLLIWLAVTLASTAVVLLFHTAVFSALDRLSVALRRRGAVGRALFGLMIFVTTFPPFPLYSTLVILSGFAFGMWQGFLVSYVAALGGALTVFSLSRSYLHGWMTRLLRASGGLARVVRAIEKQPRLLFLVRLAPYPYNLLNVLLASSNVLTLRTYALCTAIALPKLLVHTALGASISSFAHYKTEGAAAAKGGADASLTHAERVRRVAGTLGLVLCIGIFVYLYRVTSRAVDDLEKSDEELADEDLDGFLSEDLDEADKELAPSSPTTPASPVWARSLDTAPMLQRRSTTPVHAARAPPAERKAPESFAPSLFAPHADLGRSASLRAHQQRTHLSIAEQIAKMERVAEDPSSHTECG